MRDRGILSGRMMMESHQSQLESKDDVYDRQFAEHIYQDIRRDVANALAFLEGYEKTDNRFSISRKGVADISFHLLRIDYPTIETEPAILLRYLLKLKEFSSPFNGDLRKRQMSAIAGLLSLVIPRFQSSLGEKFAEVADYLLLLSSLSDSEDALFQKMFDSYPELKLKFAFADHRIIVRYLRSELESVFSQTIDAVIEKQTLFYPETEILLSAWLESFHMQYYGSAKVESVFAIARDKIRERYGAGSDELFWFQKLRLTLARTWKNDERFLYESKLQWIEVMWNQALSASQTFQPLINELVNLTASCLAKGRKGGLKSTITERQQLLTFIEKVLHSSQVQSYPLIVAQIDLLMCDGKVAEATSVFEKHFRDETNRAPAYHYARKFLIPVSRHFSQDSERSAAIKDRLLQCCDMLAEGSEERTWLEQKMTRGNDVNV